MLRINVTGERADSVRVSNRARPKLTMLEDRDVPAVLYVDDDYAQFPQATFTKIQDAINAAASGDFIQVYAGTYDTEQLIVPVGLNNLTINSQTKNAATIDDKNIATTTNYGLAGYAALVEIRGSNVKLQGFNITPDLGQTVGGNVMDIGVLVSSNATGAYIYNNTITGNGITATDYVGTGVYLGLDSYGLGKGSGSVVGNTIGAYNLNGVATDGSSFLISGNTITGPGTNPAVSNFGVNVYGGSTGTITQNKISNNIYTANQFSAGAVVVSDYPGGAPNGAVSITNNTLTNNQFGVFLNGRAGATLSTVSQNAITGSGEIAVLVLNSKNVTVTSNTITNTAGDAIAVQYTDNPNVNQVTLGPVSNLRIQSNIITGTTANGNNFTPQYPLGNGISLVSQLSDAPISALVSNNTISGVALTGIYAVNTASTTISSNKVTGAANGIQVLNSALTATGLTTSVNVATNTVSNTTGNGIDVVTNIAGQTSKFVGVSGNTLTTIGGTGIALDQVQSATVSGNKIDAVSITGISLVGESAALPSTLNKIQSNTITGGGAIGISVGTSAGSNDARNNIITGNNSGTATIARQDLTSRTVAPPAVQPSPFPTPAIPGIPSYTSGTWNYWTGNSGSGTKTPLTLQ